MAAVKSLLRGRKVAIRRIGTFTRFAGAKSGRMSVPNYPTIRTNSPSDFGE